MSKLTNWCRNIYRKALRDGQLVKGPCEVCGTTENIEGHHEDHNKPREVHWLCSPHHSRIQGQANVENGHIYSIATPESCSKAGRISWEKNKNSGWIQSLSKSRRGYRHTKESRQKMSEGLKAAWARRKAVRAN